MAMPTTVNMKIIFLLALIELMASEHRYKRCIEGKELSWPMPRDSEDTEENEDVMKPEHPKTDTLDPNQETDPCSNVQQCNPDESFKSCQCEEDEKESRIRECEDTYKPNIVQGGSNCPPGWAHRGLPQHYSSITIPYPPNPRLNECDNIIYPPPTTPSPAPPPPPQPPPLPPDYNPCLPTYPGIFYPNPPTYPGTFYPKPPTYPGGNNPNPPTYPGTFFPNPPTYPGGNNPNPPTYPGPYDPNPPPYPGPHDPKRPIYPEANKPNPPTYPGPYDPPTYPETNKPYPPIYPGPYDPNPPTYPETNKPYPPIYPEDNKPSPPINPYETKRPPPYPGTLYPNPPTYPEITKPKTPTFLEPHDPNDPSYPGTIIDICVTETTTVPPTTTKERPEDDCKFPDDKESRLHEDLKADCKKFLHHAEVDDDFDGDISQSRCLDEFSDYDSSMPFRKTSRRLYGPRKNFLVGRRNQHRYMKSRKLNHPSFAKRYPWRKNHRSIKDKRNKHNFSYYYR